MLCIAASSSHYNLYITDYIPTIELCENHLKVKVDPPPPSTSTVVVKEARLIKERTHYEETILIEGASAKAVIPFTSLKPNTRYAAYLEVDGTLYRLDCFITPRI